tara:strand:- start:3560 stop:4744 length:1185 start_codon:yes stop_codon:yes gene_type:complete
MSEEITQEGISQPEVVENAPQETAPKKEQAHQEVTDESQEDVSRTEQRDLERSRNNPRSNTLDSIIKARKEQLKEEVPEQFEEEQPNEEVKAESDSETVEDEPVQEASDSEQEEVAEEPVEETTDETVEEAKPIEEEKFTIKVNGQEKLVGKEELIRMAQMGESATQKFQEAATMKAQAEALAQLRQEEAESKKEVEEPKPNIDEEELNKLVHDIQFGEGDAAKNALKKILTRNQPTPQPQIDEMAIARQAAEQATQQVQSKVAFDNLLKDLGQEFPDVFADRNTTYLAAQYVHEMRAEDAQSGTSRSDAELFRTACKTVQDWSKSRLSEVDSGKPKAKPKASTKKVEAKRRSADVVKPSTSSKADIGEDTPPPPTKSQIVDMMRKKRGQFTFN